MTWDGNERRKMSDLQEIISKLDDLKIDVALLASKTDSTHKAFRAFEMKTKETNKKLELTIYGNGHPGLTTKMNAVEELGKDFKEHDRKDIRIQLSILGGMAGILVKLLFFK